jgi:divinyl protochlorophyllide a 8-vinyl-reductase
MSEEPAQKQPVLHCQVARMGPNSITQIAQALHDLHGADTQQAVFRAAGLVQRLQHPPSRPVPVTEVALLHHALVLQLGEIHAEAVSRLAGQRTGEYLLARRIPRAVQWLLRHLPPAWAARLLIQAIRRNAWTFLGRGLFFAAPGQPLRILFLGAPLCNGPKLSEPGSAYYQATFEILFHALVSPSSSIAHRRCSECRGRVCEYSLTL